MKKAIAGGRNVYHILDVASANAAGSIVYKSLCKVEFDSWYIEGGLVYNHMIKTDKKLRILCKHCKREYIKLYGPNDLFLEFI